MNELTRWCDWYDGWLRARGEAPIPKAERADRTLTGNITVTVTNGRHRCRCNWCGTRRAVPASVFLATHQCGTTVHT